MKYVVIGNSAAGMTAARNLRRLEPKSDVTVVARDLSFHSRCQLHLVVSGEKTADKILFVDPKRVIDEDIQLRLGRTVVAVDAKRQVIETALGERFEYDKLLIAAGGSPRLPPIEGLRGPGVFTLTSIDEAVAISRAVQAGVSSAVVIGAGLIGCEAAASLAEAGVRVTLVEVASHPLALQLDEVTGAMCAELFARNGVELLCPDGVAGVSRKNDGSLKEVKLTSHRVVPADLIVCATGLAPNIGIVSGSGIMVNRGVLIGKRCETNLPNVFAAGDITETEDVVSRRTGPNATWPAAVRQGMVASANMAGKVTELEHCTSLKTAFTLFGTHVVSIGQVRRPMEDPAWTRTVSRVCDSRGMFSVRELYRSGDVLKGAILWGDVTNAGLYLESIVNGRDIAADARFLDRLDAAKRGVEKLQVV